MEEITVLFCNYNKVQRSTRTKIKEREKQRSKPESLKQRGGGIKFVLMTCEEFWRRVRGERKQTHGERGGQTDGVRMFVLVSGVYDICLQIGRKLWARLRHWTRYVTAGCDLHTSLVHNLSATSDHVVTAASIYTQPVIVMVLYWYVKNSSTHSLLK